MYSSHEERMLSVSLVKNHVTETCKLNKINIIEKITILYISLFERLMFHVQNSVNIFCISEIIEIHQGALY